MLSAAPDFNPTLVRLRPLLVPLISVALAYFNPTLVRLRQVFHEGAPHLDPQFQSHAGSIEAVGRAPGRGADLRFQSHAGSIEAQSHLGERLVAWLDFNPTLVRLRQDGNRGRVQDDQTISIPRWFD